MDWNKAYIKATEIAALAHAKQVRFQGEPYVVHPIRVSGIVLEQTGNFELACAAVLHDTLEDTTLKPDVINDTFNKSILTLVESVTKKSFLNKAEKEAEYFRRFAASPIETVILKLADRLDNVSDFHRATPQFIERYSKNTLELLDAIPEAFKPHRVVNFLRCEILTKLTLAAGTIKL